MRVLILFCTCFIINVTNAQQESRMLTFKEIGWTIELPVDFKLIDSSDNATRMKRGAKAAEEANDLTADISETITLISASKNTYNYFNATITPFDPVIDGDWSEVNQSLKDIIYKTFAGKMGDAIIDTASSEEIIDGLRFAKFRVKVIVNNRVLFNSYLLTSLYKGYDFGISYLYLDEKTREQIETMLKNSKFSKKE